MCLAADVPLIESGTTGFNGQVQVIQKVLFDELISRRWRLITIGENRVLRLQSKTGAEELPCLYHQEYPKPTYTLHSLGEELLVYVSGAPAPGLKCAYVGAERFSGPARTKPQNWITQTTRKMVGPGTVES